MTMKYSTPSDYIDAIQK